MVEAVWARSVSETVSMLVPVPAMRVATAASTPTRFCTSTRNCEANSLPGSFFQVKGIHLSGSLCHPASEPQVLRWMMTPRPVVRCAVIGSPGMGKQQWA